MMQPGERGELELKLSKRYPIIAGVDEVGRGCLAGPVFTAAVILDSKKLRALPPRSLGLIRDSKTLSAKQRQAILPMLADIAVATGVAHAEVHEIETLGIVGATFLAMERSLAALQQPLDMVLVDGNRPLPGYLGRQQAVVKGDFYCYCIAAASILAKEARDQLMAKLAEEFPVYGFERHVGYGTKYHLDALKTHGICRLHRRNFAPITALVQALSLPPTPVSH